MILESIGDYIQSNSLGTLGTNLFLGKMPATPDYCITVYEYEGMEPHETMGAAPYSIDKPRIQVVVRAARDDYPAARDGLNAIRVLIAGITDTTISGTRVLRVTSIGSSIPLGLDDKDRPRLAANFQVFVER